jgi:uncharacterized damage-inducible protein DinB
MDLREYMLAHLASAHRSIEIAMEDLTEDTAYWQPPGTANSIARLLVHGVTVEDLMINRILKGGETVFQAGGWAAMTGLPAAAAMRAFRNEAHWDQEWRLQWQGFDGYRKAVEESARDYVASLEAKDLDREITFGTREPRSVATILRGVVINHLLVHNGEISAVKGLQGLKGLPS